MSIERPVLAQKGEVLYLRIAVAPGAKENRLQGVQGDSLRVRIAARPVKGAANRALVRFLAEVLEVRRPQVEILQGHSSRTKLLAIRGLPLREAKERLGLT